MQLAVTLITQSPTLMLTTHVFLLLMSHVVLFAPCINIRDILTHSVKCTQGHQSMLLSSGLTDCTLITCHLQSVSCEELLVCFN